jgi:hypothetical protein
MLLTEKVDVKRTGARRRSRNRRGTPGNGLCASGAVRGQCNACDEWTTLHFPTGLQGGLCGRCCPVCGTGVLAGKSSASHAH